MSWPLCMNFRDLGGLPTSNGVVRERLLFRAGDLALTTEGDAALLSERLGVRTYVDLRTDSDIDREGEPKALVAAGIQWVRIPIDLGDDEFRQAVNPGPAEWGALYVRGVRRYRDKWLQLLGILAEAEGSVVFGCVAGKDRTGIAAAVLLSCLGVPEEHIVTDYAKTTEGLAPFVERWSYLWRDDTDRRQRMIANYFIAHPEAMQMLLESLRESVETFVEPSLVEVLQRRFVK